MKKKLGKYLGFIVIAVFVTAVVTSCSQPTAISSGSDGDGDPSSTSDTRNETEKAIAGTYSNSSFSYVFDNSREMTGKKTTNSASVRAAKTEYFTWSAKLDGNITISLSNGNESWKYDKTSNSITNTKTSVTLSKDGGSVSGGSSGEEYNQPSDGSGSEQDSGNNSTTPLIPPYEVDRDGTELANLVFNGRILQDGETSATVMDNKLRRWKLTEPVRVEIKNETTANGGLAKVEDNQIRITSYSLYEISNVDVYGDEKKLFTIPNLPALAEQVYELPDGKKNSEYSNYSVKSNDAHYKKITGGKTLKTLYFAQSNNLWGQLGPLEAREYIAFWTNLAFTFSSEEFETLLQNYTKLTGGKFKDDHDSAYITEHDLATETNVKDDIKNRIFAEKTLGIGLIGSDTYESNGTKGGQAYETSLAITPVNLTGAYYLGLGVGIHEFGHTIKYDHRSSFSNDMQKYAGGLSACFIRLQKAPYCNIDLVGYHKIENENIRKLKNPSQGMLTKKCEEAEVQRNNPKYFGVYVSGKNSPDGLPYYKPTPGTHPKDGVAGAIIPPTEQTQESTQFINDFEKSVYKNPNLYLDLHNGLQKYFTEAINAGIKLD